MKKSHILIKVQSLMSTHSKELLPGIFTIIFMIKNTGEIIQNLCLPAQV